MTCRGGSDRAEDRRTIGDSVESAWHRSDSPSRMTSGPGRGPGGRCGGRRPTLRGGRNVLPRLTAAVCAGACVPTGTPSLTRCRTSPPARYPNRDPDAPPSPRGRRRARRLRLRRPEPPAMIRISSRGSRSEALSNPGIQFSLAPREATRERASERERGGRIDTVARAEEPPQGLAGAG